MIATYSDSAFLPHSSFGPAELKAVFIEPFLVLGVALFWIVTIPLVAVALMCVKISKTVVALTVRTNPLILRRAAGPNTSDRATARTAQI